MKLNPAQKLAIETIDGPVMVIAGPGTGKTQIIAERIAQILKKTDTPPDGILALTFTDSGAKAMQERLISTIGQAAYYVHISTFHSFCSSVIQEFPDRFAIASNAQALSDLERVEIFHQIIKSHQFDYLKPINEPFYYTAAAIQAIQNLKREGVSPKAFGRMTLNDKTRELLIIYKLYQKELMVRGRYDFEDMVNFVVEAFKADKELLRTYQERFLYFLVDEYQDTNSAQNQVVDQLVSYWGDKANMFVVGDPNQTIYRFSGAALENAIGFIKTYPKAQIITLDKNYRSSQTILDSAYELIDHNHFKIDTLIPEAKPKLTATQGWPEEKLTLVQLPSQNLETFWVAQKVQSLIKAGTKPEEIAVLYRHNADADDLMEMFAKLNIPTDVEGGGDVLTDSALGKLILLFKVIAGAATQADDMDLFYLFHFEFFDFNPLDVLKLSRAANVRRLNFIDLILSDEFKNLNLTAPQKFINFVHQLTVWQQWDSRYSFSQFFEKVIKDSGFLDWVVKLPDSSTKLNRLNSLFAEIKRLNNADHNLKLNSFLESLELMSKNSLTIAEQDLDIKTQAVSLSTVHRAKGREWQYVFLVKVIDKKWGNNPVRELIKLPSGILVNSDLSKKEKNEDERRLFYVALTRAKKQVFLTSSQHYSQNGRIRAALPTMFLTEIPILLQTEIKPGFSHQSQKILSKLLSTPVHPPVTVKEKDYLASLLTDFKLSPTALNTYLTCPYKFKLNNLIKVPRAKRAHLALGTAVHKALEIWFKTFLTTGKKPTKQLLLKTFAQSLTKELLIPQEEAARLKQGTQILSFYFDYYRGQFKKPMSVEKNFGFSFPPIFLGDIPLTGKVDRFDWVNFDAKIVKAVDYKTGQPKTRNQILGKTKEANLDYYRQLVFYKLLSQLDQSFKLNMIEGELDFVQQAKRTKKLRKESFILSADEVDDLKKTIRTVMKEIRALNFERTTDYRHCVTCEYRHHCWPEGIPTVAANQKHPKSPAARN